MSKEKNTIRFGIGNKQTGNLTTWRLWVSSNETYLSVRTYTGFMKLSLHSSGRWSLRLSNKKGFTVDRPSPFKPGLIRGPTIIYPGGLIKDPLQGMPIEDNVIINWFDPPPPLYKRLFLPIISKANWSTQEVQKEIGVKNDILGPLSHRSGDQVWLSSFLIPLQQEEIADMLDIKNKITVNMIGDPDGIYAPQALIARTSQKNEIFLISLLLGKENIQTEDGKTQSRSA